MKLKGLEVSTTGVVAVLDGAAGQATLREFTPLQHNEKDGG